MNNKFIQLYFENLNSISNIPNNNENDIFLKKYKKEFADIILKSSLEDKYVYIIHPDFENIIYKNFIIQSSVSFDKEWIKESIAYTESLSNSDKFILRSYTHYGDRIINEIIRTRQIKEKIFDDMFTPQILKELKIDNIDKYFTERGDINEKYREELTKYSDESTFLNKIYLIKKFGNDLSNIIIKSPKNKKPIKLFRGVTDNYLNNDDKKFIGFQSCSYYQEVAFDYLTRTSEKNGYIYEIIALPGSCCICLEKFSRHPNEHEVLINNNSLINCNERNNKIYFDIHPDNILTQIVDPNKNQYVNTLDIILKTYENFRNRGGNRTMKVNINTKNKTRRKTHSKYENTSLKGIPEEVIQDFRESVDKYKYLFGR